MAKQPKFSYREWGPSGVPADAAVRELERIRKERGKLTAEAIVEEAAPEDAPLHPAFEWDDTAAGHKFRLMQARKLVRVIVMPQDGSARRVYVHVTGLEDEGEYAPMDVVVGRPDHFALALTALERKLESASEAVEELRRLASTSTDAERSARIIIAVEAFRAAQQAVKALH